MAGSTAVGGGSGGAGRAPKPTKGAARPTRAERKAEGA